MTGQQSQLGYCPHCGESIPATRALIEYERRGDTAIYAECPGCRAVVHPGRND